MRHEVCVYIYISPWPYKCPNSYYNFFSIIFSLFLVSSDDLDEAKCLNTLKNKSMMMILYDLIIEWSPKKQKQWLQIRIHQMWLGALDSHGNRSAGFAFEAEKRIKSWKDVESNYVGQDWCSSTMGIESFIHLIICICCLFLFYSLIPVSLICVATTTTGSELSPKLERERERGMRMWRGLCRNWNIYQSFRYS